MDYATKPPAGATPAGNSGGGLGSSRSGRKRLSWEPQLLPSDHEVRGAIRRSPVPSVESAAALGLAPDHFAEWCSLHHLLHQVLVASAPFEAELTMRTGDRQLGPEDRHGLLLIWRSCREKINALVDFAEGVEHIARRFERKTDELRGARWAVEVVAVQVVIEDTLKDERSPATALSELVDELRSVCHRHLAESDGEMTKLIDRARQPAAEQTGRSA